jgi:hypothetical protein
MGGDGNATDQRMVNAEGVELNRRIARSRHHLLGDGRCRLEKVCAISRARPGRAVLDYHHGLR